MPHHLCEYRVSAPVAAERGVTQWLQRRAEQEIAVGVVGVQLPQSAVHQREQVHGLGQDRCLEADSVVEIILPGVRATMDAEHELGRLAVCEEHGG